MSVLAIEFGLVHGSINGKGELLKKSLRHDIHKRPEIIVFSTSKEHSLRDPCSGIDYFVN